MASRAEPISIETLLQKQKQEKEAAARASILHLWQYSRTHISPQPKFLTKEERAKLAIAKRAQEIREEKEKGDREKQDREALEREAEEIRVRDKDRGRDSRYGSGGGRCQCPVNPLQLQTITRSPFYLQMTIATAGMKETAGVEEAGIDDSPLHPRPPLPVVASRTAFQLHRELSGNARVLAHQTLLRILCLLRLRLEVPEGRT